MGTIDKNMAEVTNALMTGGAQASEPASDAAIQAAIIQEPPRLQRPKPKIVPRQHARAKAPVVEEVEPEEGYLEELEDEDAEAEELEEAEDEEGVEAGDEADPEDDDLFDVVVDGKDVQVTYDDLVSGYSGNRHVQQGMEEVATQRKQQEEASALVRQKATWLDQQAQQLQAMLQITQDPQIDWDQLHQTDPTEWMHQRELKRQRDEVRQGQLDTIQQAREAKQEEDRIAAGHVLRSETIKMRDAIPNFYDPVEGPKIKATMYKAAAAFGINKVGVDSITDSRQIRLLYKLAGYMGVDDELKTGKRKGKKQALKGRIKAGKQNATPSSRAAKAQAVKLAKARKTGKPDDVAATLII